MDSGSRAAAAHAVGVLAAGQNQKEHLSPSSLQQPQQSDIKQQQQHALLARLNHMLMAHKRQQHHVEQSESRQMLQQQLLLQQLQQKGDFSTSGPSNQLLQRQQQWLLQQERQLSDAHSSTHASPLLAAPSSGEEQQQQPAAARFEKQMQQLAEVVRLLQQQQHQSNGSAGMVAPLLAAAAARWQQQKQGEQQQQPASISHHLFRPSQDAAAVEVQQPHASCNWQKQQRPPPPQLQQQGEVRGSPLPPSLLASQRQQLQMSSPPTTQQPTRLRTVNAQHLEQQGLLQQLLQQQQALQQLQSAQPLLRSLQQQDLYARSATDGAAAQRAAWGGQGPIVGDQPGSAGADAADWRKRPPQQHNGAPMMMMEQEHNGQQLLQQVSAAEAVSSCGRMAAVFNGQQLPQKQDSSSRMPTAAVAASPQRHGGDNSRETVLLRAAAAALMGSSQLTEKKDVQCSSNSGSTAISSNRSSVLTVQQVTTPQKPAASAQPLHQQQQQGPVKLPAAARTDLLSAVHQLLARVKQQEEEPQQQQLSPAATSALQLMKTLQHQRQQQQQETLRHELLQQQVLQWQATPGMKGKQQEHQREGHVTVTGLQQLQELRAQQRRQKLSLAAAARQARNSRCRETASSTAKAKKPFQSTTPGISAGIAAASEEHTASSEGRLADKGSKRRRVVRHFLNLPFSNDSSSTTTAEAELNRCDAAAAYGADAEYYGMNGKEQQQQQLTPESALLLFLQQQRQQRGENDCLAAGRPAAEAFICTQQQQPQSQYTALDGLPQKRSVELQQQQGGEEQERQQQRREARRERVEARRRRKARRRARRELMRVLRQHLQQQQERQLRKQQQQQEKKVPSKSAASAAAAEHESSNGAVLKEKWSEAAAGDEEAIESGAAGRQRTTHTKESNQQQTEKIKDEGGLIVAASAAAAGMHLEEDDPRKELKEAAATAVNAAAEKTPVAEEADDDEHQEESDAEMEMIQRKLKKRLKQLSSGKGQVVMLNRCERRREGAYPTGSSLQQKLDLLVQQNILCPTLENCLPLSNSYTVTARFKEVNHASMLADATRMRLYKVAIERKLGYDFEASTEAAAPETSEAAATVATPVVACSCGAALSMDSACLVSSEANGIGGTSGKEESDTSGPNQSNNSCDYLNREKEPLDKQQIFHTEEDASSSSFSNDSSSSSANSSCTVELASNRNSRMMINEGTCDRVELRPPTSAAVDTSMPPLNLHARSGEKEAEVPTEQEGAAVTEDNSKHYYKMAPLTSSRPVCKCCLYTSGAALTQTTVSASAAAGASAGLGRRLKVLEIGCGPFCVLSINAARAGAREIVALEVASRAAASAEAFVRMFGFNRIIKVLNKYSKECLFHFSPKDNANLPHTTVLQKTACTELSQTPEQIQSSYLAVYAETAKNRAVQAPPPIMDVDKGTMNPTQTVKHPAVQTPAVHTPETTGVCTEGQTSTSAYREHTAGSSTTVQIESRQPGRAPSTEKDQFSTHASASTANTTTGSEAQQSAAAAATEIDNDAANVAEGAASPSRGKSFLRMSSSCTVNTEHLPRKTAKASDAAGEVRFKGDTSVGTIDCFEESLKSFGSKCTFPTQDREAPVIVASADVVRGERGAAAGQQAPASAATTTKATEQREGAAEEVANAAASSSAGDGRIDDTWSSRTEITSKELAPNEGVAEKFVHNGYTAVTLSKEQYEQHLGEEEMLARQHRLLAEKNKISTFCSIVNQKASTEAATAPAQSNTISRNIVAESTSTAAANAAPAPHSVVRAAKAAVAEAADAAPDRGATGTVGMAGQESEKRQELKRYGPFDLVLHEIIGDICSNEGVADVINDVQLRTGCIPESIPYAARTWFAPCALPQPRNILFPHHKYPLRSILSPHRVLLQSVGLQFEDSLLSDTFAPLEELRFEEPMQPQLLQRRKATFQCIKSGKLCGLLLCNEVEVLKGMSLDNREKGSVSHWYTNVALLRKEFAVKKKDRIVVYSCADLTNYEDVEVPVGASLADVQTVQQTLRASSNSSSGAADFSSGKVSGSFYSPLPYGCSNGSSNGSSRCRRGGGRRGGALMCRRRSRGRAESLQGRQQQQQQKQKQQYGDYCYSSNSSPVAAETWFSVDSGAVGREGDFSGAKKTGQSAPIYGDSEGSSALYGASQRVNAAANALSPFFASDSQLHLLASGPPTTRAATPTAPAAVVAVQATEVREGGKTARAADSDYNDKKACLQQRKGEDLRRGKGGGAWSDRTPAGNCEETEGKREELKRRRSKNANSVKIRIGTEHQKILDAAADGLLLDLPCHVYTSLFPFPERTEQPLFCVTATTTTPNPTIPPATAAVSTLTPINAQCPMPPPSENSSSSTKAITLLTSPTSYEAQQLRKQRLSRPRFCFVIEVHRYKRKRSAAAAVVAAAVAAGTEAAAEELHATAPKPLNRLPDWRGLLAAAKEMSSSSSSEEEEEEDEEEEEKEEKEEESERAPAAFPEKEVDYSSSSSVWGEDSSSSSEEEEELEEPVKEAVKAPAAAATAAAAAEAVASSAGTERKLLCKEEAANQNDRQSSPTAVALAHTARTEERQADEGRSVVLSGAASVLFAGSSAAAAGTSAPASSSSASAVTPAATPAAPPASEQGAHSAGTVVKRNDRLPLETEEPCKKIWRLPCIVIEFSEQSPLIGKQPAKGVRGAGTTAAYSTRSKHLAW